MDHMLIYCSMAKLVWAFFFYLIFKAHGFFRMYSMSLFQVGGCVVWIEFLSLSSVLCRGQSVGDYGRKGIAESSRTRIGWKRP